MSFSVFVSFNSNIRKKVICMYIVWHFYDNQNRPLRNIQIHFCTIFCWEISKRILHVLHRILCEIISRIIVHGRLNKILWRISRSILYSLQDSLGNIWNICVHCTSVQYTVYTVQYTVYSIIQCTVYSILRQYGEMSIE